MLHGVYFSVNSLLVMAYLIINLVRSMQYILIEYVVRRTLVCDIKHTLIVAVCGHPELYDSTSLLYMMLGVPPQVAILVVSVMVDGGNKCC